MRNSQRRSGWRQLTICSTGELRLAAANDLLDRGYGRPPVAIDATTREMSLKKIVHLVRWLPPDLNDHSKVIEPEPD
jgi:hypothetical protein